MVTLIGFLFIIANVGLLEIYMPDLVGPVSRNPLAVPDGPSPWMLRHALGSVMALLQLCFRIVDVSDFPG